MYFKSSVDVSFESMSSDYVMPHAAYTIEKSIIESKLQLMRVSYLLQIIRRAYTEKMTISTEPVRMVKYSIFGVPDRSLLFS